MSPKGNDANVYQGEELWTYCVYSSRQSLDSSLQLFFCPTPSFLCLPGTFFISCDSFHLLCGAIRTPRAAHPYVGANCEHVCRQEQAPFFKHMLLLPGKNHEERNELKKANRATLLYSDPFSLKAIGANEFNSSLSEKEGRIGNSQYFAHTAGSKQFRASRWQQNYSWLWKITSSDQQFLLLHAVNVQLAAIAYTRPESINKIFPSTSLHKPFPTT